MDTEVDEPVMTQRVGNFEFRIATEMREPTRQEADELRARRSEALTRWLLSQWQREDQRRVAERN